MINKPVITGVFIFLIVSISNAVVPQLINYQGWLTNKDGEPLNATVSVQFRIYDQETGGNELWSETQSVSVVDGIFSVLLGPVTPIPYSVFNGDDRYLALQVGNDSEMTPRKRLVSVGYTFRAYDADKIDGIDGSSFTQKVDGVSPGNNGNIDLVAGANIIITPDDFTNRITISTSSGAGGDNLGDHTATKNIILNGKWLSGDGDDEGMTIQNNGNVSIGTDSPELVYKLQVIGGNGGVKSLATSATAIIGESSTGTGVFGKSSGGNPGVYGESVNGFGGVFVGPDNDGTNAAVKIMSGSDELLMDGNEIDGLNELYLNKNSDKNVILATGGGNVGIGTSAPVWELEVANLTPGIGAESGVTANDAGGAIAAYSTTLPAVFTHFAGRVSLFSDASTKGLDLRADNLAGDIRFYSGGFAATNERMRVTNNGYVGIGTGNPNYKLDVRGTIGNNTTLYHSDVRWKKNIQTLDNALATTLALRGVQFEWRDDKFPEMNFNKGKKIGLVAQEVETVIPELVATGKDGYKSVEYTNLVALLIEAVKEQQNEIEALKSITTQQAASICRLEKLIFEQKNEDIVKVDQNILDTAKTK